MTNAQTEARTSLWIPAKPEHAKLGWTYDFEQTERISRAAYDSTGYDATLEVVEFVMAEADRRHATALAAKDAELTAVTTERDDLAIRAATIDEALTNAIHMRQYAEAQLAEANKALDPFVEAILPDNTTVSGWRFGTKPKLEHYIAARRAREAQKG